MNKYDVIIIGAGPSGIFCAYEFMRQKPDMKVLMIEKGRSIEKRQCPKRTTKVCVGCKPCSITTGFAGAGAFSDGKAIRANLKLIECPIRHLGTEEGYKIYTRLQEHLLASGVEIKFMTMVQDIIIEDGVAKGVVTDKEETYYADEIVSGIGREGSSWFEGICKNHGIKTQNGTVDVGVRVEVRDEIMKELNEKLYEAKLVYYTPTFDDKVRVFCTNPSGEVATEYYDNGLAVVNGHAYKSKDMKTKNTNFALLVSKNFTEPFKSPIEYGKHIAQLGNMLSDGKILLQRYGDFRRGRRTTAERLQRNNITPTLKDAVPGDLSLVFPHRIMVAIDEMIKALDKVTPGIASDETLLYGVEVKFYSNKVVVNDNLRQISRICASWETEHLSQEDFSRHLQMVSAWQGKSAKR